MIGGSPCNDLSIANPLRKGIYGKIVMFLLLQLFCINLPLIFICQKDKNFDADVEEGLVVHA